MVALLFIFPFCFIRARIAFGELIGFLSTAAPFLHPVDVMAYIVPRQLFSREKMSRLALTGLQCIRMTILVLPHSRMNYHVPHISI